MDEVQEFHQRVRPRIQNHEKTYQGRVQDNKQSLWAWHTDNRIAWVSCKHRKGARIQVMV
jgi:hypothetical protein